MSFTLRPATAADCEWLVALRRTTMQSYVEETFGFWDDDAQRLRFEDSRELANIQVIMVERRAAGLLHVERHPDAVFLANIQIHPAFQNRGVGSAVIRTVLGRAQASGLPVRLQVLTVNHAARALYERLGFAASGEADAHVRMIWRPA